MGERICRRSLAGLRGNAPFGLLDRRIGKPCDRRSEEDGILRMLRLWREHMLKFT